MSFAVHTALRLLRVLPNCYVSWNTLWRRLSAVVGSECTEADLKHRLMRHIRVRCRRRRGLLTMVYLPEYGKIKGKQQLLALLRERARKGYGAASTELLAKSFCRYMCRREGISSRSQVQCETLEDVCKLVAPAAGMTCSDLSRLALKAAANNEPSFVVAGWRVFQCDAVEAAVDELVAEGAVYRIVLERDSVGRITRGRVFARDPAPQDDQHPRFSDRLRDLWKAVVFPVSDFTLEDDLRRSGRAVIPDPVPRTGRPAKRRHKKKSVSSLNSHMKKY